MDQTFATTFLKGFFFVMEKQGAGYILELSSNI